MPPLMHVDIPQPCDTTELNKNNNGMSNLGDIHYQTEPNVSICLKEI